MPSAVTSTMAISTGWVSTSAQRDSDRAGGFTPSGSALPTQSAPSPASSATSPKAQRQPKASPM